MPRNGNVSQWLFYQQAATEKFRCPLVENANSTIKVEPFVINEDQVRCSAEEAVVADPLISRHLREHQKEGVRFMYSRLKDHRGVILADDMGLGKSIQAIVTTMALLNHPKKSSSAAKKCLLIVPSSLVNNWKCEFRKWFQLSRAPIITVRHLSDITSYACSFSTYPYLIISYEMALRYAERLAMLQFDILVCDEGHRLKNINGKLRYALDSLGISRRLLLTGTPIQNNMEEFFSLLDFVRPTSFGSIADFKAQWDKEDPEWISMISDCLLRRSGERNNSHLPTKNDYVLFCSPSAVQRAVLTAICDHVSGEPLVLIGLLRKAANHPAILFKKLSGTPEQNVRVDYSSILSSFPKNYGSRPVSLEDSGKLSVLVEMMVSFRQLGECAVVVSNSAKTLDMLAALFSPLGLTVLRLDGQTPVQERQALVTRFNSEKSPENVFLLSTKAGGVGLNLTGASRLILFDSDWNPALDLQAMARIWRPGQTKQCHIYRLVTAGTVDEKILHRQIKKTGLTSVINLTDQPWKGTFLDGELESIFMVGDADCETHDLLGCACDGRGLLPGEMEEDEAEEFSDDDGPPFPSVVDEDHKEENRVENAPSAAEGNASADDQNEPASLSELFRWRHYSPQHSDTWEYFKSVAGFIDVPLKEVTFAFHLSSKF